MEIEEIEEKQPVMGRPGLMITTTDLAEEIRLKYSEIEALYEGLSSLENEMFYRKNPECRPKIWFLFNHIYSILK